VVPAVPEVTQVSTPDSPFVLSRRDDRGVVTLTMNRPDTFNALSQAMLTALQQELDVVAGDDAVRLVVLAAAGKAFCAGHDLREMRASPSAEFYERLFAQCASLMLSIQRLDVPVIARVHGVATAAGCQLVAACDLAVAAATARFAVSGVNLGLFCSSPSVPLARNVHRKFAMEMLLTGEFIDAHQAQAQGLVNRVVDIEMLDAELDRLGAAIVSKPRVAISIGKQQFYRQIDAGIEQAYAIAGSAMATNMMDDAALEGVQAFIDKRPPSWGHPRS
jgi:enoyl-CoA hydratase/carnithine racemase